MVRLVDPGVYAFAKDWLERSEVQNITEAKIMDFARQVQQLAEDWLENEEEDGR